MNITAVRTVVPALLLGAALSGCGSTSHRADNNCTNIPGAVVGGVVGGAVGSQVGSGRGRDVAIGAGAATGAVVGSKVGDC